VVSRFAIVIREVDGARFSNALSIVFTSAMQAMIIGECIGLVGGRLADGVILLLTPILFPPSVQPEGGGGETMVLDPYYLPGDGKTCLADCAAGIVSADPTPP
jgi:hypothetical protein